MKSRNIPIAVRRSFPQVRKVVDARERASVQITRGDCGRGARIGNPGECAMARACKRQYGADGAIIGLARSYIIQGDKATRYDTPNSVGREITSFDRRAGFTPGTYHLAAVAPSGRFGVRPGRPRGKPNGSRGSEDHVVRRHRTSRVRVLV